MDGKKVLEIFEKMRIDRGNMHFLWADAVRYCMPFEREGYDEFGPNETTQGKKRSNPVCSIPIIYANRLGSSLHNSAFPANSYWFSFGFYGSEGNELLATWCRKARDKVHFKIRSDTNFYQESHAMMLGLVILGTAGFYTYYKNGRLYFRYIPVHKNFYIARNSDGEIDMVAILHEYTAKEAIEEFGEDGVSERAKSSLYQGSDSTDKFQYVQLVYPKTPYGEKYDLLKGEKPYGDVIVDKETGKVVRVSGHRHFPFAVPRFKLASDDLYGRSPAMDAMNDIKSISVLRKNLMEATLRTIKPPLFINALIGAPISIASGALNRVPNFDPKSVWTYPTPTDYPVGKDQMLELQESLIKAFYIDVFQAIDQQKNMTATEVTERIRQKVESIAPIVSRLQREFSGRVVMQCLDLLIENGEIEPPPLSADMSSFQITYVSNLDAMLMQGIAAQTMNFVMQTASVANMAASFPDFNNILNTDNILRRLADCNMLPADFFRSEEETAALRESQQQAAMEAQAAQSEAQSSQAALNYAKADAVANGMGYNGI